MRRHRTWRLIRIQTVCYSDSGLRKKIEENANFTNSADDILADDKFPSIQRIKIITIEAINKNNTADITQTEGFFSQEDKQEGHWP